MNTVQNITLEHYLNSFLGKECLPCDLGTMLLPFGVELVTEKDPDFLVGHFLDYLVEQLSDATYVSMLDIARAAYELECLDSELLLLSLQGLDKT
ncbi:MAG: hypothetical protein AB7T49_05425 [Oligoflexales bacterium]